MKPQDIIYSTVALPTAAFEEMSKLFVVKEIDANTGDITAFLLTSKMNRKNLEGNVALNRDKTNMLKYNSVIQTGREFVFPKDWEMRVMRGHIDDKTFQMALGAQQAFRKVRQVEVVIVNEAMANNVDQLREQITQLQVSFKEKPEILLEYLAFKAMFYRYSPRNTMMVYLQNPYATLVGSRSHFQRLGYDVTKENFSKAMQIVRPVISKYFRRDGELVNISDATGAERHQIAKGEIKVLEKTYYRPAEVFDISQTTCPKEDYPKVYHMGYSIEQHREALDNMIALAQSNNITVKIADLTSISLTGFYNPDTREIVLNNRLEDTQALDTMCHEYAHALLHGTSSQPHEIREFEAEALSYTLVRRFGMDPGEGSERYLLSYLNKANALPEFNLDESLTRIERLLRHIGDGLAKIENPQQHAQEQGRGSRQTTQHEKSDAHQQQHRELSESENFMRDL